MTEREMTAEKAHYEIHDPFIGKNVKISNDLCDRLRGRYAVGPTMENGEPEFGWRTMPSPPIQGEAADTIDAQAAKIARLEDALRGARDALRNARVAMEGAWEPDDVARNAMIDTTLSAIDALLSGADQ